MNAEVIHALGLIGLRVLAEIDPIEYKRSTDFSKFEIEQKIERLVKNTVDDDLNWLYKEFKSIQNTTQSQDEIAFSLKKLYLIAYQKAQHLSIVFARDAKGVNDHEKVSINNSEYIMDKNLYFNEHDTSLKLAVMLLLKDFKDYRPIFNYKWKNEEIDCMLEPTNPEKPFVIIEFKKSIHNSRSFDNAIKQIRKYLNFWGKPSVGVIITGDVYMDGSAFLDYSKQQRDNVFIISYDSINNIFFGEDYWRIKEKLSDY